jgi:hypothetical protein
MTATSAAPSSSSLASSTAFRTVVIVFAIAFPVTYMVCVLLNLPLFTFHPATNRIVLGWEGPRSGEGPNMTWYGWTANALLVSCILGAIAAKLPERLAKRIPLALVWLLPILAIPIVVYTLMPFWTHR